MEFEYDVLITDGDQRVALEIVRSLGMSGLRVLVSELEKNNTKPLSFASKYCSGFEQVSSYHSDEFIELCDLCKVIIPVSTNTIIQCMDKAVKKYPDRFLLPSMRLFREINDKFLLAEKAENIGLRYPKSLLLSNRDDYKTAAKTIGFPLVLKLCNDEGLFLSPVHRYRIVHSNLELDSAWKDLNIYNKDLLMQEHISGTGFGFSAVYDKAHECSVSFQHKRLREYPITGGPSTYCQSVKLDKIEETGRKLLDEIEWVGPAMVEFKYDVDKDLLVLIEINPRYWGSLPLARTSGLNIPSVHFNLLIGEKVDCPIKYRMNIKLKFFVTDFIASIKEMISSKKYIYSIFRYVSELCDLRLFWGIWMWKDPAPVLRYFLNRLK